MITIYTRQVITFGLLEDEHKMEGEKNKLMKDLDSRLPAGGFFVSV